MASPTHRAVTKTFRARFCELKTGRIDPAHSQYREVIFEADQSVEQIEVQQCPEPTEGPSSSTRIAVHHQPTGLLAFREQSVCASTDLSPMHCWQA
jgi:hypothetical protein